MSTLLVVVLVLLGLALLAVGALIYLGREDAPPSYFERTSNRDELGVIPPEEAERLTRE